MPTAIFTLQKSTILASRKALVIGFICCFSMTLNLSAQKDSISTDSIFDGHAVSSDWVDNGLTIGIDFSKYLFGEIGYFHSYIMEAGGFPVFSTTMNYGAEFSHLDNFILAPKIQGRIHVGLLNTSLTALCYTDFKYGYAVKIRPEIGIGLWNFDINYGFNIAVFKDNFDSYIKHAVVFRYYMKLRRKYVNTYDYNGNMNPKDKTQSK